MRFDEVLETFAQFFDREGIEYALIGGLALQALGYSRFTRDADFVVAAASRERVLAFATSLGYETLHVSDGYSNHLDPSGKLGRVDFMYVANDSARQLFAASVVRPVIGSLSLPVIHPTHLAAMKALAMKNSPSRVLVDSPDVKFLLTHPETDRTAVRDYFATDCWSSSMRSTEARDAFLNLDFPATASDVAALERVKQFDRMDPQQYLEFLHAFTDRHPPTRTIPEKHEPFVL